MASSAGGGAPPMVIEKARRMAEIELKKKSKDAEKKSMQDEYKKLEDELIDQMVKHNKAYVAIGENGGAPYWVINVKRDKIKWNEETFQEFDRRVVMVMREQGCGYSADLANRIREDMDSIAKKGYTFRLVNRTSTPLHRTIHALKASHHIE